MPELEDSIARLHLELVADKIMSKVNTLPGREDTARLLVRSAAENITLGDDAAIDQAVKTLQEKNAAVFFGGNDFTAAEKMTAAERRTFLKAKGIL